MQKLQQQNGYVLVFVLFFLCSMLLCGSVLAMNLSEQFAASNEAVQKAQSRLLANSGWNLAIEQLQLYGKPDEIQSTQISGDIAVEIEPSDTAPAAWNINAEGVSGMYHRNATGIVQCFLFPFTNTGNWSILETLDEAYEAGILLANGSNYLLSTDFHYPLGIASEDGMPVTVTVEDAITVSELYISGDLLVNGELKADSVYVTGTVTGREKIQCNELISNYQADIPYQVRVLERNII